MVEYIRAWIIGAVAWFMLTNAGTLAFGVLAPAEHTRSFGWALLWLGGIGFAAYFLSAVAAALAHRAPDRHRPARNAVAVLAAPVVGTAADTVRLLFSTEINWALYGSWTAVALVGAVLGFLLMRRLQTPAVVESPTGERVRVPRTYWDREEAEDGGKAEGESGEEEPIGGANPDPEAASDTEDAPPDAGADESPAETGRTGSQ